MKLQIAKDIATAGANMNLNIGLLENYPGRGAGLVVPDLSTFIQAVADLAWHRGNKTGLEGKSNPDYDQAYVEVYESLVGFQQDNLGKLFIIY